MNARARPLRASHSCWFLYALLLPAGTAHAGPGDVAGAIDLEDDMRVAPPGAALHAEPDAPRHAPHVIYLNYDGGTINSSGGYESNSQTNTSWVCSGTFGAFGDGQMKDASIQATRADWADYNVSIVTTRPGAGNYTMNMIGSSSCGGNNSGVAPVDCENRNPNDIVFTFGTASSAYSADGIATINSQELAHSYGLEHVNHQPEIMNPVGNGTNQSFLDQCYSITGSVNCGDQHQRHCGSSTQQNSHRELLEILGPSTPDSAPPTVSITAPADGETFNAPASFTVEATATDDQAIDEVRILMDGADQNSPDTSEPYSWPVNDVPVGTYTFQVIAIDTAGNDASSNEVTIEVVESGGGDPDPGDGGDDGGTGDDGGGDGGDGGGDDGGDGGGDDGGDGGGDDGGGGDPWEGGEGGDALPPGYGGSGQERDLGCACRHGDAAPPTWAALTLLVLAGRRRR